MNTRKKKMLIALMTGSLMTGTVLRLRLPLPRKGKVLRRPVLRIGHNRI